MFFRKSKKKDYENMKIAFRIDIKIYNLLESERPRNQGGRIKTYRFFNEIGNKLFPRLTQDSSNA